MIKKIEKKLIKTLKRISRLDSLITLIFINPGITKVTKKIGVKILEKEREKWIDTACNLAAILEDEKKIK